MGHYHVVTQTENALKDDEVYCVSDRKMAAETLTREVVEVSIWLYEGCDRDGCGWCGWCRAGRVAFGQGSPMHTAMARLATSLTGGYGVLIPAPRNKVLSLRLEEIPTPREACEHR